VIGDHPLKPYPHGVAVLDQMLDDLCGRELIWRRVRPPEVDRGLVFVHLGNAEAVPPIGPSEPRIHGMPACVGGGAQVATVTNNTPVSAT
jgi:hypothetical protein